MKNNPNKILYASILLGLLLIALALLLAVQRNNNLQQSMESGRFENHYLSAIEELKTQKKAVRDKLSANIPDELALRLAEPVDESITAGEEDGNDPEYPDPGTFTLRGIYWSRSMPLADINGKLRETGDQISGCTLEEIQPYQVILTDPAGNRYTNSLVREL